MKDIELTLTGMAYGGEAMGRLPDGRAVFVPYALPGERVRVRLVVEKRGHAKADLLAVLTPSPDRVMPRCRHFFSLTPGAESAGRREACGGCHYQHLSYAAQLEAKTAILTEQIERIGGIKHPPIRPILACPEPWHYRNHIQFHLNADGKLGLVRAGMPGEQTDAAGTTGNVLPIQECHLPEAALNELWPQLDLAPVPGLERVALRLGVDEDLMVIFETDGGEIFDFSVEELPLSAVKLGPGGAMVLAGSDTLTMEVLGRPFRVSAASFFQVNTRMAERMVEHVLAHLSVNQTTTLLDVYCGVGLFSAFLAPQVGRLIGVEQSPSACEDFAFNLDEFEQVELYEAAAEDALPALDLKPEVILVDPPRAGLHRQVLDTILEMGASSLIYISCDPATLARDARRLVQGGFHLDQATPFDLFPQTYHIESISFFSR